MRKKIPFVKRYHKLKLDVFTTIRGKTWMKKFKVGDEADCETPDGTFAVRVEAMDAAKIKDMTLEFLKADAEHKGCTLGCKDDFVNLLNSFRDPRWQQAALDSEMTILTLRKI